MIDNIKKDFNDFIKKIKDQGITVDEAKSAIDPESILVDFFDEGLIDIKSDNPHSKYKRCFSNHVHWVETYPDKSMLDINANIILCQNQDHNWFFIINDDQFILDKNTPDQQIMDDLRMDHLKYITRKHPAIFKTLLSEEYDNLSPDINSEIYNNIMTIHNITKGKDNSEIYDFITNNDLKKKLLFHYVDQEDQKKFNIHSIITQFKPEEIQDLAQHLEEEQKLHSFINKIASNKHKHLFNDKTADYIREVIRLNIDVSEFRTSFSNKISKYKTAKDFERGLQKYLKTISGWNKEAWSKNLDALDVSYTEIQNDVLLFEVKDFETMNKIGSSQWCIATDNSYFQSYTTNYRRQFMICDFNRDSEEEISMLGLTANPLGNVTNAHDKNDIDIKNDIAVSLFKKYIPEYSKNELADRIVDDISKKSKAFGHLDSADELEIFEKLTLHNITDHPRLTSSKKEVANLFKSLQYKNLNLERKTETIKDLITVNNHKKNNISEVFSILKENVTHISEIFDLNRCFLTSYLCNEREDDFLNIFLDEYKGDKWKIINNSFSDNEDLNLKLITKLYNHNPDNFWKSTSNTNVLDLEFLIFEKQSVYDFLKTKDIPINIFIKSFKDIDYPSNDSALKNNVFDCFNDLNNTQKEKALLNLMEKPQYHIDKILALTTEEFISESECIELLSKTINKSNGLDCLSKIMPDKISTTLLQSTIEIITNNIEKIDGNYTSVKDLLLDDTTRQHFLEKSMFAMNYYVDFVLLEDKLDKKGIPLVMESFNTQLKQGQEFYYYGLKIKDEMQKMFEKSINEQMFSKKEFVQLAKKHIPEFNLSDIGLHIEKKQHKLK